MRRWRFGHWCRSPYPQAMGGAHVWVYPGDGKGPLLGVVRGEFPHGLLLERATEERVMFIPWGSIHWIYLDAAPGTDPEERRRE